MIKETSLNRVERFWAAELSCLIDELASDQTRIVQRAGDESFVSLFRRKGALHILCSPSLYKSVKGAVEVADRVSLFDASFLEQLFRHRIKEIVGPAWIGYSDSVQVQSKAELEVRLLKSSDHASLDRFARELTERDWEHSGLRHSQSIACCYEGSDIIAAAGYDVWGSSIAHIGVVTHPSHRGKGIGKAVASRIAEHAIAHDLVAQYRTLQWNRPSRAIAASLGFEEYARMIYVRMKAK
ncbi:MAG TPA: GNAT family N-acetyltransferase [Blastocatellia bacterium]